MSLNQIKTKIRGCDCTEGCLTHGKDQMRQTFGRCLRFKVGLCFESHVLALVSDGHRVRCLQSELCDPDLAPHSVWLVRTSWACICSWGASLRCGAGLQPALPSACLFTENNLFYEAGCWMGSMRNWFDPIGCESLHLMFTSFFPSPLLTRNVFPSRTLHSTPHWWLIEKRNV